MTYEVGDKVKNGKRSEKEGGEGGGEGESVKHHTYIYIMCFYIFINTIYYFF